MSDANDTTGAANAAMRQYWNEVAGPRWVGRLGVQEARNVEVTALLLQAAQIAPGERVLDVGCGPGATTLPYAAAVGPTGHVTGIDISEPMLAVARTRVAEQGLKNVTLGLADPRGQPLPPGSSDLVTPPFPLLLFSPPPPPSPNL